MTPLIVSKASTAADLPLLIGNIFLQALQVVQEGFVEGGQVKVLHTRQLLSYPATTLLQQCTA